jgi:hypothetical protein
MFSMATIVLTLNFLMDIFGKDGPIMGPKGEGEDGEMMRSTGDESSTTWSPV